MHELTLAQDLLNKIIAIAKEKKIDKVKTAKVIIGETLISDKEELLEIFNMISAGTAFEDAKLEIVLKPLIAKCAHCGKDFKEKGLRFDCPNCGSTNIQVVSGTTIEGIEVS